MGALTVFAVTFVVYAWTVSPALGWLDSPEFVASAVSLGVAHSPGHPLSTFIGKLGCLIPVGDVVFRVNLMSAVAASFAASMMYWAAQVVLNTVPLRIGSLVRVVFAGTIAVVFAFSSAIWLQAVRAEVYALQALLLVGALASVLQFDRFANRRYLYLAGFLCGLALANHHFMTILFLLPAALLVFCRERRGRPGLGTAGVTALLGIVGLAAFLFLPVRAQTDPLVNWGVPDTWERFAWTVSTKAFQKSVYNERVSLPQEDAVQVIWAIGDNVTVPWVFLALLGLYWGVRRRGSRRWVIFLFGVLVACAAGRVVLGFDDDTADHYAYLIPGVAAVLLLGLWGGIAVCRAIGRWGPICFVGMLPMLGIAQVYENRGIATHAHSYASDDVARWEVEELPVSSVVLLSYFQTSFRMWGLQAVEQSRPDVVLLDRSFLTYPGTAVAAKRRYPQFRSTIDAPLGAGWPTPVSDLLEDAGRRPVFFQLHFNLESSLYSQLVPAGPMARLYPSHSMATPIRIGSQQTDQFLRRILPSALSQATIADQVGLRDTLLWYGVTTLDLYCSQKQASAAKELFAILWQTAPQDKKLEGFARSCQIPVEK